MISVAAGNDVTVRLLAAVGVLLGAVLVVLAYEAVRRSLARTAAESDRAKLLAGMTREEVVSLLGCPSREPAGRILIYDYGWGVVLEVTLDMQNQVVGSVVSRA